jgi:hypothetical protein
VAAVFPDDRFADFWPRNLSNQRVISPFECISGALVAANEVTGGVKMVAVPEDRHVVDHIDVSTPVAVEHVMATATFDQRWVVVVELLGRG